MNCVDFWADTSLPFWHVCSASYLSVHSCGFQTPSYVGLMIENEITRYETQMISLFSSIKWRQELEQDYVDVWHCQPSCTKQSITFYGMLLALCFPLLLEYLLKGWGCGKGKGRTHKALKIGSRQDPRWIDYDIVLGHQSLVWLDDLNGLCCVPVTYSTMNRGFGEKGIFLLSSLSSSVKTYSALLTDTHLSVLWVVMNHDSCSVRALLAKHMYL